MKTFLKWILRITISVILLLLVASGVGYFYERSARKSAKQTYPPPGQLVDIGTHKLHFRVLGEGEVTVIFDAGSGPQGCMAWLPIEQELAKQVRVITYDRAGINWSEKGPGERTTERIAEELTVAITKLNINGPIILVGHSLGGLNMIQTARVSRSKINGLVLLDSSLPDSYDKMPLEIRNIVGGTTAQLTIGKGMASIGLMRLTMPEVEEIVPWNTDDHSADSVNKALTTHLPKSLDEGIVSEVLHGVMTNTLIAEPTMLDSLPVRILSSRSWMTGSTALPPGWTDAHEKSFVDYWEQTQSDLLKLSTNSSRTVLPNSTHMIVLSEPEVVIKTILELVNEIILIPQ